MRLGSAAHVPAAPKLLIYTQRIDHQRRNWVEGPCRTCN